MKTKQTSDKFKAAGKIIDKHTWQCNCGEILTRRAYESPSGAQFLKRIGLHIRSHRQEEG